MSRSIDSALLAAVAAGQVVPCVLAQLTFKSQTVYAWNGRGNFTWNGNTFVGLGRLGEVSDVNEGTEIRADGTSVTLNGIDNTILAECLTDIWLGAPAKLWFGVFSPGTQTLLGTPYLYFSGQVDQATVKRGMETSSITLALENRMVNHARASAWRYTSHDQHTLGYPDDIGFSWVERLNDIALYWGT